MVNIPEEIELPSQDDGWWASVLQEEETRSTANVAKAQKVEAATKPSPDWERAISIYRHDEIISLDVTGHNRGGLLVEGRWIKRFRSLFASS